MRRIAYTFILAAIPGLAGTASAQVVVGGQGNNSVIVDYSVLGLPGHAERHRAAISHRRSRIQ